MTVFLVHVDGHGWYIKAASVRVAITQGLRAYARSFPKAMTVKRISKHPGGFVDFNIRIQLATQDELARAKEVANG